MQERVDELAAAVGGALDQLATCKAVELGVDGALRPTAPRRP